MASVELLQTELSRTSDWIQFAEKKAGFLSAYYVGIIGILISQRDTIFSLEKYGINYRCMYYVLIIIFITLLVGGLVCLIKAIFPQLNNIHSDKSLFYFGHIAKQSKNNYIKEIIELPEEQIKSQLAEQIYTNSAIATKKMEYVKLTTKLLVASATIFIILILI